MSLLPSHSLPLTCRDAAGVIVVAMNGHIDHMNADGFLETLKTLLGQAEDQGKPLVLDFSKVSFVASAGLRSLIVASQEAKRRGRSLAVAGAQPVVHEIFSISRLPLMMPCYLSVEAACEALR